MIYFTSDEHLNHKNILALANRPFLSKEEMNETIINNFNILVKDTDSCIHLGDICMGKVDESLKMVKQLNGSHFLIVGNHDKPFYQPLWTQKYLKAGFLKVYSENISLVQVLMDNEIPFPTYDISKIQLSHFPFEDNIILPFDEKYRQYHIKDFGQYLLHGHQHSKITMKRERMYDVGVDANNFKPVKLDDILINIMNYNNV